MTKVKTQKNKEVAVILSHKETTLFEKVIGSLEKELGKNGYSMRVGNGNTARIVQPVAPTPFLYFFKREEPPYCLADIESVAKDNCNLKVYGEENISKIEEIMRAVAIESGMNKINLKLESKLPKRLYREPSDGYYCCGEYLA
ncbi:MAG: hypothetical protein Q8R00_01190 [Candidatus Nanoarchaeia archaeon]|nr:hypothetical protein [Candidatus Nanoarchaeia archaeon]